jgi:hypothetical protein
MLFDRSGFRGTSAPSRAAPPSLVTRRHPQAGPDLVYRFHGSGRRDGLHACADGCRAIRNRQ